MWSADEEKPADNPASISMDPDFLSIYCIEACPQGLLAEDAWLRKFSERFACVQERREDPLTVPVLRLAGNHLRSHVGPGVPLRLQRAPRATDRTEWL